MQSDISLSNSYKFIVFYPTPAAADLTVAIFLKVVNLMNILTSLLQRNYYGSMCLRR